MNDLETMRQRLRDALFDTDDATWNAGEKDDMLYMATRRLAKRVPRPLELDSFTPGDATWDITLASGDYYYNLPTGISQVTKVFYFNADSDPIGYLQSGWEVIGAPDSGTGVLHVSPITVEAGGFLRLDGYGRYQLLNLAEISALGGTPDPSPLDEHVPIILAYAKEEAWRRLLSDRVRFRQWQNANQVQNVSINEIVQMVQDASRQADEEWALLRTFQKPVIGRI